MELRFHNDGGMPDAATICGKVVGCTYNGSCYGQRADVNSTCQGGAPSSVCWGKDRVVIEHVVCVRRRVLETGGFFMRRAFVVGPSGNARKPQVNEAVWRRCAILATTIREWWKNQVITEGGALQLLDGGLSFLTQQVPRGTAIHVLFTTAFYHRPMVLVRKITAARVELFSGRRSWFAR